MGWIARVVARLRLVCRVMNTSSGVLWGIVLIIAGALAIAVPVISGLAAEVLVGWMVILGGIAHLVYAFQTEHGGRVVWKALVGLLYLLVGIYLLVQPWSGLASLTLVMACFFLLEGVFEVLAYFEIRPLTGSGWLLADGIITLVLGLWVWVTWPSNSYWFLGTVVGISLLVSGMARLMLLRPLPSTV